MSRTIKKVAVLGSGVMGSGIAAHFANIGLEVLMLDILPFDLKDEDKDNPTARNSMADRSLAAALKNKLSPFYDKSFAARITTGNFTDDMSKISDVDWIIEVVIERLDIKQQVFEQVEKYRKEGTLITSNTSGIPINQLVEGRSDDFKKHFCGTHFFNPPRYLRLFEVIPTEDTTQEVTDFFMNYGDVYLGKQTVLCKDTPGFIGNRIGFYSGAKMFELTEKYDLTIEEVDALTGPAIGRPKTGTYRLQDLVGIDTSVKVTKGIYDNCPEDEYVIATKDRGLPKFLDFLVENKFFGDKSGQGFYRKTNETDEKGRRVILALNLKTLEYAPSQRPNLPSIGLAKKVENMSKRLKALIESDDKGGQFLKEYFAGLFAYASNRIPEFSDHIYSVDDAMTSGYAWDYGPFQYWDMFGIEEGIKLAESYGEKVADWVKDMLAKGETSFYSSEAGLSQCYDIGQKSQSVIPGAKDFIILDNYRDRTPILKKSDYTLHDLGEGVLCFEFTSKMNSIGTTIGQGLMDSIALAENGDWKGIVIGNNSKNFSVGANLMEVAMLAYQKEWDQLNTMVGGFQDIVTRIRRSAIPVVAATQGYVFGGGCEILMHCDGAAVAAESYIGLVEVGVGLLPGGCGTKEFALRTSDGFGEGDVQIPGLVKNFRTIATAGVAKSANEAFSLNYLLEEKDTIVVNASRVIGEAKKMVLNLSENYTQPLERKDIHAMGRTGLGALYTAINEFRLGRYMSDHDVLIAKKIANVMCGGDLTGPQKVSETYLLNLEKEAFLSLLGEQKTLERIQFMLEKGKPLRN